MIPIRICCACWASNTLGWERARVCIGTWRTRAAICLPFNVISSLCKLPLRAIGTRCQLVTVGILGALLAELCANSIDSQARCRSVGIMIDSARLGTLLTSSRSCSSVLSNGTERARCDAVVVGICSTCLAVDTLCSRVRPFPVLSRHTRHARSRSVTVCVGFAYLTRATICRAATSVRAIRTQFTLSGRVKIGIGHTWSAGRALCRSALCVLTR